MARLLQRFLRDEKARVSVGLVCVLLIPVTFIIWLVTWTPVAMMIDAVAALISNPQATRIFNLMNVSAAGLLIGEIVLYIVWWLASAFHKEDQTYSGGSVGY